LDELHVLDGMEEERALCNEEKLRKERVISDLGRVNLLEETSWRQKSRTLWLREGDKCLKFFYQVANSNRGNNSIELLLVNGSITSDQTQIMDHIAQFYDRLFTK
jgi:hypothetical protein